MKLKQRPRGAYSQGTTAQGSSAPAVASEAPRRAPRGWWTRPRRLVAATLVIGLLATSIGFWALRLTTSVAVEDRFTAVTTDTAAQVERRLAAIESAALAARGLFDTEQEVSSLDFFRFTDALARGRPLADRFPGLTTLAAVDGDGRVIVTAPSHPVIRNTVRDALALDQVEQILQAATVEAVPITGEVVSDAIVANLVVATARYGNPLVSQMEATPADRRAATTGWTIALLEADRLVDGVLPETVPGLGARLLDGAGAQLGATGSVEHRPVQQATVALDHADGTLQLELVATRDLASPTERTLPGLVGLMGMLLTVAGAVLMWLVTTQRERALGKVAEATAEVVRTNTELTEANDRLRDFAGVVAHDLRGPLTGILGMVTSLGQRIGDDLDPMNADLLDRAERAATNMDVLISDVLRYAEAGVAPTDLRVMDLAEVVDELLDGLGPLLHEEDILEVDARHEVVADPTGLRRVMGNLIGNALKYRRGTGPAHVEVRSRRRDDRVVVEVVDDGPGIPAELRDELATAFQRGDTSQEGSGLGLAICRRIVTHHAGTLELDDSESGGTLVRFDLPAA